ncbi:hypothetical protein ACP70R_031939 [Stipagrostis hirtigluma subsp. patula]
MFVEFMLKPLWRVYQRGLRVDAATAKWLEDSIVSFFSLEVSPRELHSKDPMVALNAVLRAWLPLTDSVMTMLVECMPDPVAAQALRVARLLPERKVAAADSAGVVAEAEWARRCVAPCSASASAPVVVFVSRMFALSPLYDSVKGDDAARKHVQEVELRCLYEMLRQDLTPVASVVAGKVVTIHGLGQHMLKSATLSPNKNYWPFLSTMFQVSPMLKVAVEHSNPADLGALVKGLNLLNQADPFVEYTVSQRGEHILCSSEDPSGALHQEFAGEVCKGPTGGLKALGTIQGDNPRGRCWLKWKHEDELEAIAEQVEKDKLERYRKTLLGYLQRIESESSTCFPYLEAVRKSIVSGFQFATNARPICHEPMWGLAFLVEHYIFADNAVTNSNQYNIFTGQVITAVKEACREAVLQSKPRLVEPIYLCELTTPSEHLHGTYAVLGDYRARVLKEEMQEGTSLFTVHAHLPIAESSEFSEKLRNGTSGSASAFLAFSHWQTITQDPFFIPKTQEEIEELGDGSSIGQNLAKRLMNSVRRRKGLYMEEKVVEHGCKQRTLAKKV